jgi:formamidase
MASLELTVDRSVPVREQPERCHTRWHPDIAPALRCNPGDEVILHTRDAVDGQLSMESTHEDLLRVDRSIVHPLTGPIHVQGAEPGDVLVVDLLEISTGSFGYTAQFPGFGFLRDEFPDPFLVRWEIAAGTATSPDLAGVHIPASPFMGTMGVAPSRELLARITERERDLASRGAGGVALPDPRGAVPEEPTIAREGLRTKPPRENAGNLDVKQMIAGTRVLFPVWTAGALFSAGDGHHAQGDGEACGTAIETEGSIHVRFDVIKGGAGAARDVRFSGPERANPATGRFVATTGVSVYASGEGEAEDLNHAARSALSNMIDYLTADHGYGRREAYAICSVAVDLKVSELVDAPNFVVTAVLPLGIFDEDRSTSTKAVRP